MSLKMFIRDPSNCHLAEFVASYKVVKEEDIVDNNIPHRLAERATKRFTQSADQPEAVREDLLALRAQKKELESMKRQTRPNDNLGGHG